MNIIPVVLTNRLISLSTWQIIKSVLTLVNNFFYIYFLLYFANVICWIYIGEFAPVQVEKSILQDQNCVQPSKPENCTECWHLIWSYSWTIQGLSQIYSCQLIFKSIHNCFHINIVAAERKYTQFIRIKSCNIISLKLFHILN